MSHKIFIKFFRYVALEPRSINIAAPRAACISFKKVTKKNSQIIPRGTPLDDDLFQTCCLDGYNSTIRQASDPMEVFKVTKAKNSESVFEVSDMHHAAMPNLVCLFVG